MRGEKQLFLKSILSTLGSPPHARGKGTFTAGQAAWRGITPACAGKSWTLRSKLIQFKDHPRMRGEKTASPIVWLWEKGSPPHARGKVRLRKQGKSWRRITPACAGKSVQQPDGQSCGWDHPRMRGEKPSPSSCLLCR